MKNYLLFILFVFTNILFAQNPADIDVTFNGNPTSSSFDTMVNTSDGGTIIGGTFTSFVDSEGTNTINLHNIVKVNENGVIDNTFNNNIGLGFNYGVKSITLQTDGKILVGGIFTTFNGLPQNRLVRLNTDGTKDTSFNIGNGFTSPTYGGDGNLLFDNAYINTISVQPNGKILVGGFFNRFNNFILPVNMNIVRLDINGTRETTIDFNPQTIGGQVFQILLTSDNKILVSSSGNPRLRRLNTNGTTETNFTGFNSSVSTIAIQTDGKIIAGGSFTEFNDGVTNVNINRLIRVNADGTIDNTFNIGSGFEGPTNPKVLTINIQDDGKILVGGIFTTFNGTTSNNLVKLNTDGTKDTSFDSSRFSDTNINGSTNTDKVSVIKTQLDGKVFIGGTFDKYQSITSNTNNIIRLKGSTAVLSSDNFQSSDIKISLYPNPTSEYLNISTLQDINSYEIYDINGRTILSNKTSDKTINVSNLTNGMYIINIKTDSGTSSNKFIKN